MEYNKALDMIKAAACCSVTGGLCNPCPFKNTGNCTHVIFNNETILNAMSVLNNGREKSYLLKIYIDTDGDWTFNDDIYTNHSDEQNFYGTSRKELCDLMIKSIHNIKSSLQFPIEDGGLYYISDWFECLDTFIPMACKKFDTFTIDEELGNSVIKYELLRIHRKDISDIITYKVYEPVMDFSIFPIEDVKWDKFRDIYDDNYDIIKEE